MNQTRPSYVVEYSFSQRCFHVESFAEALGTNASAFARNRRVDYIPLGIYPTREAANAACSALQPIRDARSRRGRKP